MKAMMIGQCRKWGNSRHALDAAGLISESFLGWDGNEWEVSVVLCWPNNESLISSKSFWVYDSPDKIITMMRIVTASEKKGKGNGKNTKVYSHFKTCISKVEDLIIDGQGDVITLANCFCHPGGVCSLVLNGWPNTRGDVIWSSSGGTSF